MSGEILTKDITGHVFGSLTVLRRDGSDRKRQATWLCACACGTTTTLSGSQLRSGKTRSCGCLRRGQLSRLKFRHGLAKTAEHRIWWGMIQRCTNPRRDNYPRYGGKGVRVDPTWLGEGGFERFLAHIGPRPSPKHSVDRFPDRHGPYAPGNVRWATAQEQADNTDRAEARRRSA